MAKDTRQNMIERAAILLATKGLQGTSFSEVLGASGAPRGSLYYHFPDGKDELVLEAIRHAGSNALEAMKSARGRPADEVAQLFLSLWRTLLVRTEFHAGCAVAAVTIASSSARVVTEAASIFRSWRQTLGDLLAEGGIPFDRAPAMAATLIAASEGATIVSRAERNLEPFDLVAEETVRAVRAAIA